MPTSPCKIVSSTGPSSNSSLDSTSWGSCLAATSWGLCPAATSWGSLTAEASYEAVSSGDDHLGRPSVAAPLYGMTAASHLSAEAYPFHMVMVHPFAALYGRMVPCQVPIQEESPAVRPCAALYGRMAPCQVRSQEASPAAACRDSRDSQAQRLRRTLHWGRRDPWVPWVPWVP